MAIPEKYGHISFVPPSGVRREAARGLAMRREHSRGGTAIGIARARDLSNGKEVSPSTVRRMKAFFDRHAQDRKAKGFRAGEEGFPSNGKIADLLWGGRSGESWARKVVRQMNAADERTYSLATETSTLELEAVSQRSTLMSGVERRYFGSFEKADATTLEVEHRADPETGKKQTYIVGYAAKFGTDSLLLGDFIERLEPTAFDIVKAGKDKSGKPLSTRCLFNHDPNHLLGRFPTTMKLIVDKIGLRYECLLPESRQDIAEMIARQDLRGSSFSFVVDEDGGEKWITENGQSIRLVRKIKSLLDVSPVTYPAYDDATVAIAKRSYEQHVASRGDCGRENDGRFGFGNACAKGGGPSSSEAGDKKPSGAAKALAGAAVGAGIGAVAGVPGAAIGAAVGALAGAVLGGKSSKVSLDTALKRAGVSLESIDKAAKALGVKMKVEASGNDIVATGGSLAMQISGGPDGSEAHFMSKGDPSETQIIDDTQVKAFTKMVEKAPPGQWGSGNVKLAGRLASTFTKAAKAAGVSRVSASLYDKESVEAFKAKGFKVVSEPDSKFSPTVVRMDLPKAKAKRSYDELKKFLDERAFCPTGPGGGVVNTCGSKGVAAKTPNVAASAIDSIGDTPPGATTIGKIASGYATGAAAGLVAGSIGGLGGALAGSVTGGLVGAAFSAAKAISSSVMTARLEGLKASMKISDASLKKASGRLFNPTQPANVFALDGKTIAIEQGDSIALISNGSPFSKNSTGTSFHYQPGVDMSGRFDLKSLEAAAQSVKAKSVSVEVWHDDDVKVLEAKGYRKADGYSVGYSSSKGVYEKTLGRSKRSDDFVAEYEKTKAFFEQRAFCPTGEGGGIVNKCGKYMQIDVKNADSVKKSAQAAQEFVDKAREEQLSKGGKDKGQPDEGGGVQTWSKGDNFPWTVKQVGNDKGYVQGIHPDGSKTKRYSFKDGNSAKAMEKAAKEIKSRKSSRADQIAAEMLQFLKDRRA